MGHFAKKRIGGGKVPSVDLDMPDMHRTFSSTSRDPVRNRNCARTDRIRAGSKLVS